VATVHDTTVKSPGRARFYSLSESTKSTLYKFTSFLQTVSPFCCQRRLRYSATPLLRHWYAKWLIMKVWVWILVK